MKYSLLRAARRHISCLTFCIISLIMSAPSFASSSSSQQIDYFPMVVGLLGGLALFLYGLDKMSTALKRAAGDRMRHVLAKLTSNRFTAVLTGTGVTAVIQSSSVTTVLVVGFVSAGLFSLTQAVGVIMGANIGTTVTAQIIAFKITKTAMVMVALGFLITFVSKNDKLRHYGEMIFGLGLIFLGMNLMGDAMGPLRTYDPFIQTMAHMDNVLVAIALAATFTALVQSSSATTGIVIVLAAQGFISLPTGIALAMGANIGTCVTALLASLGKSREAKQTSWVHIIFNVVGVIIWLPFIGLLSDASIAISPSHTELSGSARQAAEIPRQIANANTMFNVINTLIMAPFASQFVWLVRKLIPPKAKPASQKHRIHSKYLTKELLRTPDLALAQAQLELGRIGRRVCNMVNTLPPIAAEFSNSDEKDRIYSQLKTIEEIEDEVDYLHTKILSYLGQLRLEPLSDEQSAKQIKLISITDQLETIADIVVDAMLPKAYQALNSGIQISPIMRNTLDTAQERVNQALLDCVNAIRREDSNLAEQVLRTKRELNFLLQEVLNHQAEKLSEQDPSRMQLFHIEMEWIESLKRIYTVTKRIAKVQLRKRAITPLE